MRLADHGVFARARAVQVSWPLALVAIYAAANLVLAVALTAQPQRSADLQLIYDWCSRWLRLGENLYATTSSSADYPPNAIVMLSPLALLTPSALVPLWAAATFTLTFVFAYVVVRVTAPRATLPAAAWPVLLFLCWGGVRMLLQFTRLSVTLAYAAVWLADSNPLASGFLLGLALGKPHIAGPIALWMLFTKRGRPLAVACGVAALLAGVYVIRVHASPVEVVTGYWNIMRDLYGDPGAFVGRTSIRRWTVALAGQSPLADLMWIAGAGLLLLVPCRAALADARSRASRASAAVPALFCLWSLLVWFHLGNNLVLAFPAFAFLLLAGDPGTRVQRFGVAAMLQIALMLDAPVHLLSLAPRLGPFAFLVLDLDRFVVLTAFFYLAYARASTEDMEVQAKPCPLDLRTPATG